MKHEKVVSGFLHLVVSFWKTFNVNGVISILASFPHLSV